MELPTIDDVPEKEPESLGVLEATVIPNTESVLIPVELRVVDVLSKDIHDASDDTLVTNIGSGEL